MPKRFCACPGCPACQVTSGMHGVVCLREGKMPQKDPEERRQYRRRPEVRQRHREGERRRRGSTAYAERRDSMTRDQRWAVALRKQHGMQPEQWQAMLDEQRGLCYLCLQPLPEDRSKVHVDHDHAHCRYRRSCPLCRRGLACHNCNIAIGLFRDSPELLRTAADNLARAQLRVQALAATVDRGQLF